MSDTNKELTYSLTYLRVDPECLPGNYHNNVNYHAKLSYPVMSAVDGAKSTSVQFCRPKSNKDGCGGDGQKGGILAAGETRRYRYTPGNYTTANGQCDSVFIASAGSSHLHCTTAAIAVSYSTYVTSLCSASSTRLSTQHCPHLLLSAVLRPRHAHV